MKINFKKIGSVLASVVMIGSTMGIGLAANYPMPFTAADTAIVYGANANLIDGVQAEVIKADLEGVGGTGTTTTCSGGDCYLFQVGSSTMLNLNDSLTDIKSGSIDSTELPNVLADLTYVSGDGVSYGYSQEIKMHPSLNYQPFAVRSYDDKKPHLGIYIKKNDYIFNYTISWAKQPESDVSSTQTLEDLENSKITILGKEYTLLNAYNESKNGGVKLVLMGGAYTGSVNRDETISASLGENTYTIRPAYISDTKCKVCISINGGAEEKCSTELEEGETLKLSNGVQFGVRDISYAAKAGTIDSISISLGAEKITLQNASTVEVNDVEVDGLTAYITQSPSGSKEQLGNIIINWRAREKYYLTDTNSVEFPAFGGIKLASGGFHMPSEEVIEVIPGSQTIELKMPIKDGTATIPLLYGNETAFNYIGSDSDELLVTNDTSTLIVNISNNDDVFVASWNSSTECESYLLSLVGVSKSSGINYTTIKNELTGDTKKAKSGNDIKFGNVVLTTSKAAPDDDSVTLVIGDGGSFKMAYTPTGAGVYLPVNRSKGADKTTGTNPGYINAHNSTGWDLIVREADKNGNIGSGEIINLTLAWSSEKPYVQHVYAGEDKGWASDKDMGSNPSLETEDNSDVYIDYLATDLGTKAEHSRPSGSGSQYSAKVYYYGGETYGNIYLADVQMYQVLQQPQLLQQML